MIFTRDRLKMLGLVMLCSSLALALILPAIGIQKVKRDGFITGAPPADSNDPVIEKRELANLPVWVMMAGTGVLGFGLWILADVLRPPAIPTSKGFVKRKR